MTDMVNHPPHYSNTPHLVEKECIEYTRQMYFSQGNAFKYVYRLGSKNNAEEDLDKAIWYLEDAIRGYDYLWVSFDTTDDKKTTPRASILKYIAEGRFQDAILLLNTIKYCDGYDNLDKEMDVFRHES